LDLADIDVSDLLDTSDRVPAEDADGSLNIQHDLFVGHPEPGISVDDTVREEAGSREDEHLDIQVDDDVVLEFDGGLLDEGIDGKDDIKISGSDIVALAEDIDLPEGNMPQDFSSSFLDDTFREGEAVDVSFVSSEEDSVEDLLDEDLALDQTGENVDYLPADIDALALDADFEAFLNKTASGDFR